MGWESGASFLGCLIGDSEYASLNYDMKNPEGKQAAPPMMEIYDMMDPGFTVICKCVVTVIALRFLPMVMFPIAP